MCSVVVNSELVGLTPPAWGWVVAWQGGVRGRLNVPRGEGANGTNVCMCSANSPMKFTHTHPSCQLMLLAGLMGWQLGACGCTAVPEPLIDAMA